MKRNFSTFVFSLLLVFILLTAATAPVLAQEATPVPLTIFTPYPSRIIGPGESVSMPLKVRSGTAGTVSLEIRDLPKGWSASFRGGSQIVDAVYTDGINDASVDLRLEPAADTAAGIYPLTVAAVGSGEESAMPLSITIKEKLPPRLSLTVDGLPNKRGTPTSNYTFTATLKNEGGEDLQVALSATEPENMKVKILSSGQEVFELPLAANESKNLTISADPLIPLEAGTYPFTVQAAAGDIKSVLELVPEVVGEGSLSLSAPDGRLSAEAVAGQDNPLKIALVNTGTAPLLGVELSSSEPSGGR